MATNRPQKTALKEKELRFVDEYMISLNAKEAAKLAGFKAHHAATRLMKDPLILAEIELRNETRRNAKILSAEQVQELMSQLATLDPSQAYDDAGFMKPISEMPESLRSWISQLETAEIFAGSGDQRTIIGHAKKVKFEPKTKGIEFMGDVYGLRKQKVEVTGKLTLEQLVTGQGIIEGDPGDEA